MSEQTDNKDFLALMEAKLGAAMSHLEVRLIDRFASKKEHEADVELLSSRITEIAKESAVRYDSLSNRVGSLEQSRAGQTLLSTWQRWLFGGAGFAVLGSLVYIIGYHIH